MGNAVDYIKENLVAFRKDEIKTKSLLNTRLCNECARSAPDTSFTFLFPVCNECLKSDAETRRRLLMTFVIALVLPMVVGSSIILDLAIIILTAEIKRFMLSGRTPDLTFAFLSMALIAITIIITILAVTVAVRFSLKAKTSNRPIAETVKKMQQYILARKSRAIPIYKLQTTFWLSRDELFPVLEALIAKNQIPYSIDDVHDVLEHVA
jgi:hypothetical protein